LVIERTHDCRNIAVDKEIFEEKFFELSSGLMEETAQKLADSGFRPSYNWRFSGIYRQSPPQFYI
jgi:hypothetical protein